MEISKVGVLGCGLMGHGITQITAQAGWDVVVREVDQERLDKGIGRIEKQLARAVEKGRMEQSDADATRGRIAPTLDYGDLSDCDLVVEAITEDLQLKLAMWGELDGIVKDKTGFVVNRLLVPYLLDAIRAYEEGVGSIEQIDAAMKAGANHPMGPFTLLDFVGLDTTKSIADIMFDEYRERRFAAPPTLRKMVSAGFYGRKSGRGFYDYSGEQPVAVDPGL